MDECMGWAGGEKNDNGCNKKIYGGCGKGDDEISSRRMDRKTIK